MHHSQVAVDAHQTNKEDPTVEGDVERTQYDFAHGIPKEPLVPGLVRLEGEGAHQEQICNRQIQEAHVSHAPETRPESSHPDGQGVSHEAQEEEDRVENREKGGSVFLILARLPKTPVEVVVVVIYSAELCEDLCHGLCDGTSNSTEKLNFNIVEVHFRDKNTTKVLFSKVSESCLSKSGVSPGKAACLVVKQKSCRYQNSRDFF